MTEEKPQYGWYVKGLIVGFTITGLIGVFLFLIGLYLQDLLGIILIISGASIVFLFLWPGLGMIVMHLFILKRISFKEKMNALNDVQNPQILDVGCGTGRSAIRIAKELKNGSHLYGIDIYEKMAISGNALDTVLTNARIEKVEEKTTFQYGSATEIPFEDERFDIIHVASVLHEVHDPKDQERAVQEIYRVLRPGGIIYLSEWNRKSWKCIALMGMCVFVFKSKEYWNDLMKKNKFKDITYENTAGFGIFTARK